LLPLLQKKGYHQPIAHFLEFVMIFWKRRQYQLPRFPGNVIPAFRSACEDLPQEKAQELEAEVDSALESLYEEFNNNGNVDIRKAEALADRCKLLLSKYNTLDEEHRKLAVGAVRYFATLEDAFASGTFASGLVDDAKVMNYVLEELGIEGQFIEIR